MLIFDIDFRGPIINLISASIHTIINLEPKTVSIFGIVLALSMTDSSFYLDDTQRCCQKQGGDELKTRIEQVRNKSSVYYRTSVER